ncbi:MAG: hypothetical protein ABH872_04900 [Candidatus Omnitrophota bacterium]
MFDFSKLSDMTRMAQEAKKMQDRQESFQNEQLSLLKKISQQLDEVVSLFKKGREG